MQNSKPLTTRIQSTPSAKLITAMRQDLRKAEQQAKTCPTNAGICPKCGRLSRFCAGC